MTRGNQRELARAKNMKKNQEKQKKQEDGLSAAARKERIMAERLSDEEAAEFLMNSDFVSFSDDASSAREDSDSGFVPDAHFWKVHPMAHQIRGDAQIMQEKQKKASEKKEPK